MYNQVVTTPMQHADKVYRYVVTCENTTLSQQLSDKLTDTFFSYTYFMAPYELQKQTFFNTTIS